MSETEDPKPDAQGGDGADTKKTTLPDEVEVPTSRGPVKIPRQKALELATVGLNAEERQRALDQREAALKGNEAAYNSFQDLRKRLESDPKARKAFLAAMDDPERVVSLLEGGGADDGDDDGDARRSEPKGSELRSTIAQLAQRLDKIDERDQTSTTKTAIKSALGSYPWLTGKRADLAYAQVLAHVHIHPNDSIEAAAAVVANDVRTALEEDRQEKLDKSGKRKDLETVSARSGSPVPVPEEAKSLNKDSWRNGKLHQAAMRLAANMGITGS